MQNVFIVGATSAIALATARQLASNGANFYLCARDDIQLANIGADLKIRGAASVATGHFDAAEFQTHEALVAGAFEALGHLDLALICHGSLPDQQACITDFETALKEIQLNGTSVLSILTHLANRMETQGSGTIAAITSVAGDRGRQSNYIYGAAKSLVSTYLEGLRNRLSSKGVHVMDIRPGFVDTPMTANIEKNALFAQPEKIATDILKAVDKQRHTIYTPFFWRYIMRVIRSIPDVIFKRLSL